MTPHGLRGPFDPAARRAADGARLGGVEVAVAEEVPGACDKPDGFSRNPLSRQRSLPPSLRGPGRCARLGGVKVAVAEHVGPSDQPDEVSVRRHHRESARRLLEQDRLSRIGVGRMGVDVAVATGANGEPS